MSLERDKNLTSGSYDMAKGYLYVKKCNMQKGDLAEEIQFI